MKNKGIRLVFNLILSYIITLALARVSHYSITGIDLILPSIFVFVMLILTMADKYCEIGFRAAFLFSGAILSTGSVLGSHIFMDADRYIEPYGILDLALIIILCYFFYYVTALSVTGIEIFREKYLKKNRINISDFRLFCVSYILILICYLPYFIVLFPGNIGKDTFESVDMINGLIPLSNHQPIAFTAMLALIIRATGFLNSLTLSLGIFSFIHMCIYIAGLAYIIVWMNRREVGRLFVLLSTAFFALHPFMAMYSIYLTKDVLFSIVMVLIILQLFELRKANPVFVTVLSLLMCLLRNNGIYILFGMGIWILIIYKDLRKKTIICLFSVFAIYAIYKGAVFKALEIEESSFAESASIPLSQLGYVISIDASNIDETDREFLDKILSEDILREAYTIGYTDTYKFHPDFDDEFFNENKAEYIRVWLRALPQNLGKYIEAYLAQTCGYWHYGKSNTVATQGVVENDYGVVSSKGVGSRLIAALMLGMRKAPLLCILSSMGAQIYAIVMVIALKLSKKQRKEKEAITPFLPVLLLWGTIMIATPAYCLFRYLYPAFILWPVTIYALLNGELDG